MADNKDIVKVHPVESVHCELLAAIRNQEFVPYLQPVVDDRGDLYGVEALARWRHPVAGLLTPALFMPAVSSHGLAGELTRSLLSQTTKWLESGEHTDLHVGINLDAGTVDDPLTVAACVAFADRFRGREVRLMAELTERQRWVMTRCQRQALRALREKGVELALNDFGTGCSTLEMLAKCEADIIKLDRSFVGEPDRRLAACVLYAARIFNLRVIAEGVETAAQLAWLKAEGVRLFQGFYFSPPVDPAELYRSGTVKGQMLFNRQRATHAGSP